ncbi:hypothetical protein LguiB_028150 [Lonicera macranthoides]
MRNEALGVMMGPLCVRAMMDWDTRLQVYGESLSFMHKPINDGSCNIWVMKEYGVAESWTKQFTIDLSKVDSWRPSYFRENGNTFLVTYGGYLHSGFGDGGNLLCYDPKSKQIKKVEGKEVVSFVGTYRESLVLLKGLNGVLAKHGNFGVAVTSGGTSLLPREKNDDKANQLEENEGRIMSSLTKQSGNFDKQSGISPKLTNRHNRIDLTSKIDLTMEFFSSGLLLESSVEKGEGVGSILLVRSILLREVLALDQSRYHTVCKWARVGSILLRSLHFIQEFSE